MDTNAQTRISKKNTKVIKKEKAYMPEKLKFLQSVRFWKLIGVGVVEALVGVGSISPEIGHSISMVLLGSVAVRTVDKFGGN